jgi:glycosyltransferase involved in cell wall biosynthesis
MTQLPGVSIIIVNYNNGCFLGAAIDSALGQDHPLCEVIVVDDCSTDNSREIAACYADRIRCVLRETNAGQTIALNTAWPLARYPILIFLDSDDLLFPHAASTVAGHWTTAAVKAQFPLATIDREGRQLGHVNPRFPPNLETALIRAALLRTGQSPSAPGSGNAYSRSLLDRVRADGGFEIENPRELFPDAVLDCNAPFYGEIVTLYQPLACYRIHDGNDSAQNTVDLARFAKGARYSQRKLDYLAQRCCDWGIPFDAAAAGNRSPWLLDCRLAMKKLARARNASQEPISDLLYYGFRAHLGEDGRSRLARTMRALWFVSVALSPRCLASRMIALRFLVAQRPRWLAVTFSTLTKVKTSAWPTSLTLDKSKPGAEWNR